MKKWEILDACRQGRIDHNASGSITVQLDLTSHRIRHSNSILLNDLIRELQRISTQMENSYEKDSYWVPALDIPTNLLSFFTIFPLTHEMPVFKVHAQMSATGYVSPSDENKHKSAESQDLINKANNSDLGELSNSSKADPILTKATYAINSSNENQSEDKINTALQTSFPLNVQASDHAREHARLIAISTLESYYSDNISSYDEVNACIEASPLPDATRNFVFTALPSWKPVATSDGILNWPQSGGIKHLLPLEQSVGLRIRIHTLGDSVDGKYTGRISIEHIPQLRNFSLIKDNLRDYDKTLEVEILTTDIFDKLNLAWSLHLSVNIAVSVEKYINQAGRAIFTVIQAFCHRPENFDAANALRITDALFIQPDEVDLWTTGE